MICLLRTISLKMTIFMENFFCKGCPIESNFQGCSKAKIKVGGNYQSTPPCLSLPELQRECEFGPSENPNPHSSRTDKELLVVKQKRTLFPHLNIANLDLLDLL